MENENLTELSIEQKWEKATIANNFIFYKIMQNNHDVCKELLEILLKMKIDHIGYAVKRIDRAIVSFEKLGFSFESIILNGFFLKSS